jgi:hypothetical protein
MERSIAIALSVVSLALALAAQTGKVVAFTVNASERLNAVAESIQTLQFSKTGK